MLAIVTNNNKESNLFRCFIFKQWRVAIEIVFILSSAQFMIYEQTFYTFRPLRFKKIKLAAGGHCRVWMGLYMILCHASSRVRLERRACA